MEEAGYIFDVTLTREERDAALRAVRRFCIGGGVGWVPVMLFGVIILVSIAIAVESGDREGIWYAGFFSLVLLVAIIAPRIDAKKRSRPVLSCMQDARLFIGDDGVRISQNGHTRVWGWEECTAMVEAEQGVYVLMMTKSHLAIPQRVLAAEWVRDFEVYVRGKCLKQRGSERAFPVVMNADEEKQDMRARDL